MYFVWVQIFFGFGSYVYVNKVKDTWIKFLGTSKQTFDVTFSFLDIIAVCHLLMYNLCLLILSSFFSVDEFIGRIFSVIHSNDPIARALTLRTMGSLSALIPERKHVHHSIRVGLDSNDRVEVYAAIYAATCFAKRSK